MSWIAPKTNWVATDFFNVTDYNRIAGDVNWLKNKAQGIYGNIPFETMKLSVTYTDYPYASTFNAIENNLYAINEKTYNLNIGQKKTYYANQPTWTYEDLNRIESALVRLKALIDKDIEAVMTLPIKLGDRKAIRV